MKFDPARLFEPRKPPKPLYPTISAELDAIRANKKKLSVFDVMLEDMAEDESIYLDILELAFARGLAVVLEADVTNDLPQPELPTPRVYVARPEELWRVPALRMTYRVGWSHAMDAQRSMLLGYTRAQWKRFVAWQRQRACEGTNVFTLLSREQKARAVAYGKRCFGAPADVVGMTFFLHRSGRPRANAASLVPRGFTLARTGLQWESFTRLFPSWKKTRRGGLHTTCVSRKQTSTLLEGLADGVQFLTPSGWT